MNQAQESNLPIKFQDKAAGKVLAIQICGRLTRAEFVFFAPEFERLVQLNGKLRILFDLAGFEGWEAGALWEGIKFDVKHFADIERIAMIGETKWEQGMATFSKPFTQATIRFFDHAKIAEARKWLGEV